MCDGGLISGPIIGGVLGLGSSIIQGNQQRRAVDRATDAGVQGQREALGFLRESRDLNRQDLAPFLESDTRRRSVSDWLIGIGDNPFQASTPQGPGGTVPSGGFPQRPIPGFPGAGLPGGVGVSPFAFLGDETPRMAYSGPQMSTGTGAETAGPIPGGYETPMDFFEGSMFNRAFETDVANSGRRLDSLLGGQGLAFSGVNIDSQNRAINDSFGRNFGALLSALGGDTGALTAGINNNTQFGANAAGVAQNTGNILANSALQRGQISADQTSDMFGLGAYTLGNLPIWGSKK